MKLLRSKALLLALCASVLLCAAAWAVTEVELATLCRSGSVQELKVAIAGDKDFARRRFHEMDTPLILAATRPTQFSGGTARTPLS